MKRNKIFISYSHKDQTLFNEFLLHLKPFQDDGQLTIWSDEELQASQDWYHEIQQAIDTAAVGVLLVSPGFLASDFIRDDELPPLLREREKNQIGLTCLYLKTCAVTEKEYSVDLGDGHPKRVKLTKYQGLNGPNDTVAASEGDQRNKLLATATIKLKALFAAYTRRNAPRTVKNQEDRYTLTIRLERTGDQLIVTYLHPEHGNLGEHWPTWQLSQGGVSGEQLYQTLFGPPGDDHSSAILQAAFSAKYEPSPILHPLRLRLQTDDSLL